PGEVRFEMAAPGMISGSLRISPDGQHVAYISTEGGRAISLRPMGAIKAQRLAGTENAPGLFGSPDSRFIAFFADRKLKKISIAGGSHVEMGESSVVASGAGSIDGVVLYPENSSGGGAILSGIPDAGGAAKPVTEPDPSQPQAVHVLPQFLPDNQH